MKNLKSIKLVVCDMAGTTVRDEHEVEQCFAHAARQTGLRMTGEEILSVQGWGKRHVFETFWERQTGTRDENWLNHVESSYACFRRILEDHYLKYPVKPTDGCMELFSFLNEKGVQIALTTGFYRKVADIILDKLGWLREGVVQVSIASDEVANGRPRPDMIRKAMQMMNVPDRKKVINIGDTPSDIQSGKNAGCLYSCCVTNGTHSANQLLPFAPDRAFSSMRDFKSWLSS